MKKKHIFNIDLSYRISATAFFPNCFNGPITVKENTPPFHTDQCALSSVHSPQNSRNCKVFFKHCTHKDYFTMLQCTMFNAWFAVYNIQFIIYISQCPLCSILSGTIHPSVAGSRHLINGTCWVLYAITHALYLECCVQCALCCFLVNVCCVMCAA